MTEEQYITALKNNPHGVRNIPNPTEEMQLVCVEQNGMLLQYIKNPTDRFDSISEMMGDLRLSQGFTMGKTQRHEPYDFATQMIPAVDPDTLDDFSDIDDPTPNEEKKKSMLSKIASIPQKYIVLGAAVIFLIAFLGAFLGSSKSPLFTFIKIFKPLKRSKKEG